MRARIAAKLLRAFGDGTRLRIILLLVRQEMSVSELAHTLRCPRKRVSRHLQYLAARKLVEPEMVGRRYMYRLRSDCGKLPRVVLAAVQA
ncbi:winged helix-turn-helix transcriptional regulator, partial [bacterium]|nr:winged helix-turn-helix transcriptional regulator [bacterium]